MSTLIAARLDHIHITLDTLLAVGDYTSASHIIRTIGPVWETHEYLAEGRHYIALLLNDQYSGDLSRETYAQVCQIAGNLARHQSDYPEAQLHYLNGLELTLTDVGIQTSILGGLGETAFRQGQYEAAREHYEHHHALSLDADSRTGTADALTALGRISMASGDLVVARTQLEQSLRICQEQDYRLGLGWLYNAQGELARAQQNYQQAASLYQQSIQCFVQLENLGAEMLARQNLAFALLATGHITDAEKLLTDVLRFWQKGRSIHGMMLCLIGWSAVLFRQQRYEAAAELLLYATAQLEHTGAVLELDDRFHFERMLSVIQHKLSATRLDDIAAQVQHTPADQIMTLITPSTANTLPSAPSHALAVQLTGREADILRLVAQGMPDKKMAERLVISPHTVNAHLRNIYRKLNVNTRTEAAYIAQQLNLI